MPDVLLKSSGLSLLVICRMRHHLSPYAVDSAWTFLSLQQYFSLSFGEFPESETSCTFPPPLIPPPCLPSCPPSSPKCRATLVFSHPFVNLTYEKWLAVWLKGESLVFSWEHFCFPRRPTWLSLIPDFWYSLISFKNVRVQGLCPYKYWNCEHKLQVLGEEKLPNWVASFQKFSW